MLFFRPEAQWLQTQSAIVQSAAGNNQNAGKIPSESRRFLRRRHKGNAKTDFFRADSFKRRRIGIAGSSASSQGTPAYRIPKRFADTAPHISRPMPARKHSRESDCSSSLPDRQNTAAAVRIDTKGGTIAAKQRSIRQTKSETPTQTAFPYRRKEEK